MNKHLLFVHIPKTAGTSFRLAMQEYFGKENTFYDYNPLSTETSEKVMQYVYDEKDIYQLYTYFQQYEKLFFSGHFGVGKYMSLFETLNIITFVREPVAQVLSHYKHHCNHLGYTEDLITFVKDKRFKNIQSKTLAGKPLELFGFVGLTEKYADSVHLINDYYNMDIKVYNTNKSTNNDLLVEDLDENILELIKEENSKDVRMYEKAKKIFQERMDCFNKKEKYKHIWVQEHTKECIVGVAIQKESNEAVSVIVKDGNKEINLKASGFKPGMLIHKVPRNAFVGFEYRSSGKDKLELKKQCV